MTYEGKIMILKIDLLCLIILIISITSRYIYLIPLIIVGRTLICNRKRGKKHIFFCEVCVLMIIFSDVVGHTFSV